HWLLKVLELVWMRWRPRTLDVLPEASGHTSHTKHRGRRNNVHREHRSRAPGIADAPASLDARPPPDGRLHEGVRADSDRRPGEGDPLRPHYDLIGACVHLRDDPRVTEILNRLIVAHCPSPRVVRRVEQLAADAAREAASQIEAPAEDSSETKECVGRVPVEEEAAAADSEAC